MYPARRGRQSKESPLPFATIALAVTFLIFSFLLISNRNAASVNMLMIPWLALGAAIAGLLIAKPYYALLSLIAFTPFYPLVRRLILNTTNDLGMIIGSWQDIFLGLLVVSGIIQIIMSKTTITLPGRLRWGNFFLAALGIWSLIEMTGQDDLFSALYGFRYTYMFSGLYFATLLIPLDEKQILTLRKVLQGTLLLSALFGVVVVTTDLLTGTKFAVDYQLYMTSTVDFIRSGGGLVRFGSTFVLSHGAAPAYILLMLLGLSAYFFNQEKTGWIVSLIALLAMATTMSRAALGSIFASTTVFLFFLVPRRALFSRSSLVIAAVLALFIGGMLFLFPNLTRDYYLTSNSGDAVRRYKSQMAMNSSKDYPLGHGTGTAGSSVAIASNYLDGSFSGDTNIGDGFHLKVLYELGYPGFLFWAVSVWCMIGSLWRYLNAGQNAQAKSFLAVSISYMIAILIYSLTSNQLEIWPTKIYFWLMPALAIVYAQYLKKQPKGQ